jgi:Domain of unknown function (DUF6504)
MTAERERAIQVEVGLREVPVAFRWRNRPIAVREILDDWEEAGCWWAGEAPRRVYRLLGSNGTVYELHQQAPCGWSLQRVFD